MFYNADRKQEYLQKCDYEVTMVKRIMTFFNKASALEFLFDKDISKFNVEEFESLFYTFECKTTNSIKATVSMARRYVYWELSNNYLTLKNIILDLPRFKGHNLDSFIYSIGSELSYIENRNELYKLVSMLVNPRDKAIICLLYEGICGEDYYDLRHLRKQDCDFSSNTIIIMNKNRSEINRIIYCDPYTMGILYDSIHTEVYIKHNGKTSLRHNSMDLLPSDYVIRTSKGTGIPSSKLITLTFENLRKSEWDIEFCCQYLTPTTVRDSGIFNMVVCLEVAKVGLLTNTEFRDILKYYGKSEKLLSQYRSKYNIFKTYKEQG